MQLYEKVNAISLERLSYFCRLENADFERSVKHDQTISADKRFLLSASACYYCIMAYTRLNQNLSYFNYRNTHTLSTHFFVCFPSQMYVSQENKSGRQPHDTVAEVQHNHIN